MLLTNFNHLTRCSVSSHHFILVSTISQHWVGRCHTPAADFSLPFKGFIGRTMFKLSGWMSPNCSQPSLGSRRADTREVAIRIWNHPSHFPPIQILSIESTRHSGLKINPFPSADWWHFLYCSFVPDQTAKPPSKITSAKESFMCQ